MKLVKIFYHDKPLNVYFWDKESARHYLKMNALAYKYEPEAYRFETFEPLDGLSDDETLVNIDQKELKDSAGDADNK